NRCQPGGSHDAHQGTGSTGPGHHGRVRYREVNEGSHRVRPTNRWSSSPAQLPTRTAKQRHVPPHDNSIQNLSASGCHLLPPGVYCTDQVTSAAALNGSARRGPEILKGTARDRRAAAAPPSTDDLRRG